MSASPGLLQHAAPLQGIALPQRTIGTRLALFALRFYKMYLSAQMGGTCRFEPSCSTYAIEAVERFGVVGGCWLTLKRLGRCQPLSRRFGYDPVPDTWPSTEGDTGTSLQGLTPDAFPSFVSELLRPPKDKEAHS